jgi:hypothetical protein
MIPATPDCIFNEAIFDLDSKVLALISKEKKESLHMVAKVNEFGDVVPMKIGRRSNGKDFAEERKSLETFYEYYIEDVTEIKNIVSRLAVNSDTFDVISFIDAVPDVPKTGSLINSL